MLNLIQPSCKNISFFLNYNPNCYAALKLIQNELSYLYNVYSPLCSWNSTMALRFKSFCLCIYNLALISLTYISLYYFALLEYPLKYFCYCLTLCNNPNSVLYCIPLLAVEISGWLISKICISKIWNFKNPNFKNPNSGNLTSNHFTSFSMSLALCPWNSICFLCLKLF